MTRQQFFALSLTALFVSLQQHSDDVLWSPERAARAFSFCVRPAPGLINQEKINVGAPGTPAQPP
jgi:hypothetical protein